MKAGIYMEHANGGYKINKNPINKTVGLYVSGRGEESAIKDFLAEYNSIVSSITPSEYDLIIDCKDMELERQEIVDKLVDIFIMYKNTGFKNVILQVKKNNNILKMQLNRVTRMSGLGEAKFQEV